MIGARDGFNLLIFAARKLFIYTVLYNLPTLDYYLAVFFDPLVYIHYTLFNLARSPLVYRYIHVLLISRSAQKRVFRERGVFFLRVSFYAKREREREEVIDSPRLDCFFRSKASS